MCMFMWLVVFPCWALGSFLYVYMCRKIVMAAGRFLAAWECVLRENGIGGLRERFEDEVV